MNAGIQFTGKWISIGDSLPWYLDSGIHAGMTKLNGIRLTPVFIREISIKGISWEQSVILIILFCVFTSKRQALLKVCHSLPIKGLLLPGIHPSMTGVWKDG
jgi:hypothetical protein